MIPAFALRDGLTLVVTEPQVAPEATAHSYPTANLQRGLLLVDGSAGLCGEGVGFGVPVLKRGARAVFSGSAHVMRSRIDPDTVTITYVMDRCERLGARGRATRLLIPLDLAREGFALVYRRVPALRRFLMTWSNCVRRSLRLHTRFEPIPTVARIPVAYTVTPGAEGLHVCVDLSGLPPEVTEVVVMNELGAAYFDEYVEEGGRTERGRRIGAWDLVAGPFAAFRGGPDGVWFRLRQDPDPAAPGTRLYRGREMARGRLAWAGFGYSLRPGPQSFTYTVVIGRGGRT